MGTLTTAGGTATALVALGLAIAGCGSSSTTETSPSSSASSAASSSSSSEAPPTSKAADGKKQTLEEYLKEKGITQTPAHRGDPGTPTLALPTPEGWADAGSRAPANAWGGIVFADPSMASDPPTILVFMSRLTGDIDQAKVFELAPAEMQSLPGYESMGEGSNAKLSGYDAYQLGAGYEKDGVKRMIAQKTVVVPAKDGNGIFLIQLKADGTEDQIGPLMEATSEIDKQTVITP